MNQLVDRNAQRVHNAVDFEFAKQRLIPSSNGQIARSVIETEREIVSNRKESQCSVSVLHN